MTVGWKDRTGGVSPSSVLGLVFASKAETKNRSILTKFVDDAKRDVFFIIGKDLIQEDLDDLQDG